MKLDFEIQFLDKDTWLKDYHFVNHFTTVVTNSFSLLEQAAYFAILLSDWRNNPAGCLAILICRW